MTEPATPPVEDEATEEVIAAVAVALLEGESAAVIVDLIGELPGLVAGAVAPVFTERGWFDWIENTAGTFLPAVDADTPADRVRANDSTAAAGYQAAYLVTATVRLAEANATGDADTMRAAHDREDQLFDAHIAAQEQRAAAAEVLAAEIEDVDPDDDGEVLFGWHGEQGACEHGCREAHGRNFNALVRPRIGYPGQVHPNCKCSFGEPWNTTNRVDDIDPATREAQHMGKQIETRAMPVQITEFREAGEGKTPGFTARALNYGVRDSYGTSWAPGVFSASLRDKLPPVVWGHDWNDPIGRVVSYTDGADGLDIDVELDDFDAVPRAKQAYAQLRSGTMKEFSFAFLRGKSRPDPELRDTTQITEAEVDEFSVVLNGSVPGTAVNAIRSRQPGGAELSGTRAQELLTGFATGKLSLADALDACKAPAETRTGAAFEFRAVGEQTDVDPMAVLADVHTKLADLSESLDGADVVAARRFFQNAASSLWELSYLLGMVDAPLDSGEYYFYAKAEGEKRSLAVRSAEQPAPADDIDDEAVLAALARLSG